MALLSGEMMVEQRAAVIERFREGKEKVLVTTNVCARGRAELGQGGAEAAVPKITYCWPACRKNLHPHVFQSGQIRVLKVIPGLLGC